jgi:hypothetical protein
VPLPGTPAHGRAVWTRTSTGTWHPKAESHTTTDHDEIRSWVEEHDGKPAAVRDTGSDHSAGVLRIDFPGGAGEDRLEHISVDEWFATFEDSDLAFLYQAKKASGEDSTFFTLVRR